MKYSKRLLWNHWHSCKYYFLHFYCLISMNIVVDFQFCSSNLIILLTFLLAHLYLSYYYYILRSFCHCLKYIFLAHFPYFLYLVTPPLIFFRYTTFSFWPPRTSFNILLMHFIVFHILLVSFFELNY